MTTATATEATALPGELAGYPGFLTPRVVAAGAYYAGFWARVGANIIDTALQAVLYLVLQYLFQAVASIISAFAHYEADTAIPWTSGLALAVVLLYYNLVLVARSAATPGMRMLAMHIVEAKDVSATPARRTLYTRGVIWLLFSLTAVLRIIDSVVVAFHPTKRSVHDIMVGTAVVRRAPQARSTSSLLCTVCGEPVDEGTLCPKHGGSLGLTLTLSGHTASMQTAASILGFIAIAAIIGGIVLAITGNLTGLAGLVVGVLLLRVAMSLTQLREWARWATFVVGLMILVLAGALGVSQLKSGGNLPGLLLVLAALGALISACVWTPETYREFHRSR